MAKIALSTKEKAWNFLFYEWKDKISAENNIFHKSTIHSGLATLARKAQSRFYLLGFKWFTWLLNPELPTWLSIWSLHWDQTGAQKSSTWISDQGRLGAQVEMGFNQLTNYKQHQQNALEIYTFNIEWIACNILSFFKGTKIWLRSMIESPSVRDSVLPLQ